MFSSDGRRIAFERDGQIVVKDLADGSERVVAAGTYPFWGGARTVPVRVAQKLRPRSLTRGRGTVRVGYFGACRVTATLKVSADTARRLGLGRTRTIAKAFGARDRRHRQAPAPRYRQGTKAARTRTLVPRDARRSTLDVTVMPDAGTPTRTSTRVQIRRFNSRRPTRRLAVA